MSIAPDTDAWGMLLPRLRQTAAGLTLGFLFAGIAAFTLAGIFRKPGRDAWLSAAMGVLFWAALTPALVRVVTSRRPAVPKWDSSPADWFPAIGSAFAFVAIINGSALSAFAFAVFGGAVLASAIPHFSHGLAFALTLAVLAAAATVSVGAFWAVSLLLRTER